MASHTPPHQALETLLVEHRQLKGLLEKIDRALEQRRDTIDQVGDLLGQLGDRLIKHFALEEEGGYFAEAVLHAPQLVSKANALLAQHPRICTQAVTMAREIRRQQAADEDWWQQTAIRFRAFREELLRHERHENGLLQEAYTQDLGAHD
jgi:hypothetical protein